MAEGNALGKDGVWRENFNAEKQSGREAEIGLIVGGGKYG